MNNLTASVSLSSSKNRLDLGRSIRDSIFYYEDLMGPQESQPTNDSLHKDDPIESVSFMDAIFDEAMFENQVRLVSKDREQRIQHLLKSIESFQAESDDSE